MRQRIVVRRFLILVLTVSFMLAVFFMSGQTGRDSSSFSYRVSRALVLAYDRLNNLCLTEIDISQLINQIYQPVRKAAHLLEYALLSTLLYIGFKYCTSAFRGQRRLTLGFLLVFAALDELHQYYTPGRHGKIQDIAVDMLGTALGILFVDAIIWIKKEFLKWWAAQKKK